VMYVHMAAMTKYDAKNLLLEYSKLGRFTQGSITLGMGRVRGAGTAIQLYAD